ncbi:MAG: hypothetical protein D6788_06770 [Planctomycetota bacterium]|nr:MAG: hypothetical protein D6788_06770 [Planctomycetota bacterium]
MATYRMFSPAATEPSATILRVDRAQLEEARRLNKTFRVERFPLDSERTVDLELRPFRVVGPRTKFVLGRKNGPDVPFDYDASRIAFFRGRVAGRPGSDVFLALGEGVSTGYIDLDPGGVRHRISSKDSQGRTLAAGRISVFPTHGGPGGLPPGVPVCGVAGNRVLYRGEYVESPVPNVGAAQPAVTGSTVGLRHLELAVETDYDLFRMFGDATATFDYVVLMYGEVSNIYMRDVDTWIEVVFVRVWDQPDDLFNGPDPLFQFYPYWEAHMGAVQRDAAQFFSGRRDFPFGGQAFLQQLCAFGYGVVGYAAGFFPDPSKPSPYNWDVSVTAHELGHTCNAPHTHGIGLDTCDNPNTTPRRGSIMAYCGQTWSGMNANMDNYFHRQIQSLMESHITTSACIALDCNMNGVPDATDIATNTSEDVNGNGVPDECEDCNGNGILDPLDISLGGIPDVDGNGIPDECEPDCNGNGVPDARDIALGTSTDLYGNDVPDECEADCNGNGVSDYTEIQADMTLDKDRNTILDTCQDCDGDGILDFDELSGAHNLWVASGLTDSPIRRFLLETGVLIQTSTGGLVRGANDLIVVGSGPTARILVSSDGDARVMEFNAQGQYVGDLVPTFSGGLVEPTGLVMTDGGTLLVADATNDRVIAYDGTIGAPIGDFIPPGSGGLVGPFGMTFGPNGNLFVTSSAGEVLEYDGVSGAFVRVLVKASDNGGLTDPRGLAFKPDGNLLVASYGTDEVLEFDGLTGRPRGKWAQVGTETAITQDSPWGVRVGPNGHVYVTRTGTAFSSGGPINGGDDHGLGKDNGLQVEESHLTDARMFEYDVCTGNFRRTEIGGNDHGLDFATGFDFVDGFALDCNLNFVPDDCDIASGFSADVNRNGTPDECEVDCNHNGRYDHLDIWPRGSSLDCNCNFVPDECDIGTISTDCNGNGRPDECEAPFDCNDNGIQDICDAVTGVGTDCNGNGLLDSCESIVATGVLTAADFEDGLPPGWTASGSFTVTGACMTASPCNGSQWAYAGDPGSCTYGDGEAGTLLSPPIDLPLGDITLSFCEARDTETDFDFVEVSVNDELIWRASGATAGWTRQTFDLSRFEGQTIRLVFRFQSDPSFSGLLGWQVDDIRVTTTPMADCNSNGVPDECEPDGNGNGIPDACEGCVASSAPTGDPEGPKTRHVSFAVPEAGSKAVRVTFESLPPPLDVYNNARMWAVNPRVISENSGVVDPTGAPGWPTTVVAELGCSPDYRDWSSLGLVHLYGRMIVPGGSYRIQAVDSTCPETDEASYSPPLIVATSAWGDVTGGCTPPPCSPPDGRVDVTVDVTAVLDKFRNAPGALGKARADVDPIIPDQLIQIADVTRVLDAFRSGPYPFDAVDPPPCP